jgi:hypothetical protein
VQGKGSRRRRSVFKRSTNALLNRPAWVIVFTKKNRRGEIRGRVLRAP